MKNNYHLYDKSSPYIIGFHGCNQDVADALLREEPTFKKSTNHYDWLGNGMYFWENNPIRAWEYILEVQKREPHRIQNPTVVGAILDLGHCLNLVESRYINLLRDSFHTYKSIEGVEIPSNKNAKNDHDKLFRHLDCAVIEFIHSVNKDINNGQEFDSVRGMFIEGNQVYEGAGFHEKTHVQ